MVGSISGRGEMIDRESLAYKAGCDARIAGKGSGDNPFLSRYQVVKNENAGLATAWRDGWQNKDYELRAAKRRH